MLRFPLITIALTIIAAGLYFTNISTSLLYFDRANIFDGEIWRVTTGHFIHTNTNHLLWNCVGLLVLGSLIELRSTKRLWLSLGTGLASVSGLLLSPFSSVDIYCGMSGVLNTLLLFALWMEWQVERKWLYPVIGTLALAKIVIEVSTSQALFTDTGWSPYPLSHLAGYIGGVLSIAVSIGKQKSSTHERQRPFLSGYLTSKEIKW